MRNFIRALAWLLNKATGGRLHPDAVTMIGFLMHIPIALLVAFNHWGWAALFLVVFGLFDVLDGELARLQHRVSNAGGLLDASTDRMKEVLLYTGAAYAFATGVHPTAAVWAAAACGASICVSYVRAKGETIFAADDKHQSYADLNKLFRDGLAPFEVRMALFVVGLLTGQLIFVVALLAVLASLAALQRLWTIRRALVGGKS